MTTRWARVVRGQVVAVLATFAAAFSHGVADGAHPPLAAMALALAFSSVICVFLAAARLSRVRLAVSVAISQLLYHGLFSVFGVAGASGGVVSTGHHGTVAFTPGVDVASTVPATDQWMLVAHVAAAVVTFAMLVRGEHALLALGALAVLLVTALAWRLPPTPVTLPSAARFPTAQRADVPHRLLILVSALTHRGPPLVRRFA
jgi:hypothetical protein